MGCAMIRATHVLRGQPGLLFTIRNPSIVEYGQEVALSLCVYPRPEKFRALPRRSSP